MNILVLTSAMIDQHFAIYQDKAKIKPNPSNQYFYSKLIKCLAIQNKVSVVTLRPMVKGMFAEKSLGIEKHISNNATYYYSHVQAGMLYKTFSEISDVIRTAKEAINDLIGEKFVIVVDTLRYNLLRAAIKLGKMYNAKVVGMLTDNPFNLSGAKPSYASSLKNYALKCDGYLSLTQKMVDNLSPYTPCYIFEGLVDEEIESKKAPISNYFFFAGSLYERYGVKRLVDAFHGSQCKNKLVIAGSGPLSKYIDKVANEDSRILFLSQISKDKVTAYERSSIANINPRPINKKLDSESVPSKLLEYISIGTPTISTKYDKFYKLFNEDVYFIDAEEATTLAYALEDFEKLDQTELKKKALVAKSKAFEFYGLDVQCEAITCFLNKIK